MGKKDDKIAELERRIADLERRPIVVTLVTIPSRGTGTFQQWQPDCGCAPSTTCNSVACPRAIKVTCSVIPDQPGRISSDAAAIVSMVRNAERAVV